MENIKSYSVPLQESTMSLLQDVTGEKTHKGALENAVLSRIRTGRQRMKDVKL